MSQLAHAFRPRKLTLFLNDSQQDSRTALELVREYYPAVEIVKVDETDRRVVPRLYTPLSAFEGLHDIRAFLKEEKRNPIVREYLDEQ